MTFYINTGRNALTYHTLIGANLSARDGTAPVSLGASFAGCESPPAVRWQGLNEAAF